jgi:hypothetical protein
MILSKWSVSLPKSNFFSISITKLSTKIEFVDNQKLISLTENQSLSIKLDLFFHQKKHEPIYFVLPFFMQKSTVSNIHHHLTTVGAKEVKSKFSKIELSIPRC